MNISKTALGIELGSTRIKSVLLDENHRVIASGSFDWENRLENGIWTYDMKDVITGIQTCYRRLADDFAAKYGTKLTKVGVIGISGMMHGYIALDKNGELLVPFRTWRNTITAEAAEKLSALFDKNIPQRWSIAHLCQAMLKGEEHLPRLKHLTTLAGYIHEKLTGKRVMGIGEASGMFPVDSDTKTYDRENIAQFDELAKEMGYEWKLSQLLPEVLTAGEDAGCLTMEGALFLDPTGTLESGIPLAPPEGDAGTGMVATNSLRINTGNVSAGTSDFAMVVVDHMPGAHEEIDMVTTPTGAPVAMVHCNNCTSDINAWAKLFGDFLNAFGVEYTADQLYGKLFQAALDGENDCGGLMAYNYESGEHITGASEGRPLFMRKPTSAMTLGNFMRAHFYSALASLKIGLDILIKEESIVIEKLYAHGGFFRVPEVGQRILSAAVGAPVSVMQTADSGGPYGMALLASYRLNKAEGEMLEDYLESRIFSSAPETTLMASQSEIDGFCSFVNSYRKAFPVELTAIDNF